MVEKTLGNEIPRGSQAGAVPKEKSNSHPTPAQKPLRVRVDTGEVVELNVE